MKKEDATGEKKMDKNESLMRPQVGLRKTLP